MGKHISVLPDYGKQVLMAYLAKRCVPRVEVSSIYGTVPEQTFVDVTFTVSLPFSELSRLGEKASKLKGEVKYDKEGNK